MPFNNNEDHLKLLIESAKDYAIFTQDTSRRVNGWNFGAELMFGYTEDEILGEVADIFFTPEDRKAGVPEYEVEKALIEGRAENERWHVRRDGSRFYGSGMVRPIFDTSGAPIGCVKIMRDLTEQKKGEEALRESEERLRITMNSALDYAIITLDVNGFIIGWSKGAEMIFGYKEDEATGKHTEIIFIAEDRAAEAPKKEMQTAVREGRANDERWHERKNGTRLFMSGVMTPIYNNSKLAGFVKVARDLTDRKLLDQQKDEFIIVASHELKTPVTSIKGYTEILLGMLGGNDETDELRVIKKLDNQVNRLIELIKALLDTTKLSEPTFDLNIQQIDLNQLIDERIDEIQEIFPTHKLVFDKGKLPQVRADRERIGQVVTNLLSNAIKYSPDGGQVTIATNANKDNVHVSVKDLGIGVPEHLKDKIFERFFRAKNAYLDTYPGMGLGLYISAGIITRHGGTISVEGNEGNGSLFRFSLPIKNNGV